MSKSKYTFTGLNDEESKWAQKQFKEYKRVYHIDNFSDEELLKALVYREAIQERYKKKIEDLNKSKKVTEQNIIPKYILTALNDNLEQILILKDKLGLFRERKEDEYKAFEILEKKFDIWKKNHIEERKVTCPFCSEIFFLNIRTDKYKEAKLKLFENKVLCNKELWRIYKEKKITKEEFAKILNVSEDYIDWLEEEIYNPSK